MGITGVYYLKKQNIAEKIQNLVRPTYLERTGEYLVVEPPLVRATP
jgi:hypothetical protein